MMTCISAPLSQMFQGLRIAGERSRWASVVRALFSKMIQIFSGNPALLETTGAVPDSPGKRVRLDW